jgi:hypothetical protein
MLKGYYTELVFVNVYGGQENDSVESIPPAYACIPSDRYNVQRHWVAVPRPGWESIPGLLKRSTNTGTKELTVT